MNLTLTPIALGACLVFLLAYWTYGRWMSRIFQLSDQEPTPAVLLNDGEDFVPAKAPFLLGQHFSAIAAAGPIVGPILAGLAFGWLPALCWIVFGAIFFGAVHDMSSLVGSVRHKAESIAEIMKDELGNRAYILFLLFIWLSLIYVITAFADLTTSSFVESTYGGGVATCSMLYLGVSVLLGFALYRWKMSLGKATAIFLPLMVLAIWGGQFFPLILPTIAGFSPKQIWSILILGYCYIASITPMWALLQPRGYLGGFFLYIVLAMGIVGIFIGGAAVQYPAFLGWTSLSGMPLFPMLFVTVACGACSGFHGLVSTGTTSKQISKETDTRLVGYGGMLLEGVIAVIALSTVMMLKPGSAISTMSPDRIYAAGLSTFVTSLGIPYSFAMSFTLLAFATFIYDTLDVTTRLCRYMLQELFHWQSEKGKHLATCLTLGIPAILMNLTLKNAAGQQVPAWKVFWTIFGSSNQLLAALTLLAVTLWLKRTGKRWAITAIPMVFMMGMTVWSLVLMARSGLNGSGGGWTDPVSLIAVVLLSIAVLLVFEARRTRRTHKTQLTS